MSKNRHLIFFLFLFPQFWRFLFVLAFAISTESNLLGGEHHHHRDHRHRQEPRQGRQAEDTSIDFSAAYEDPDTGLQCIDKEAIVQTKEREKLLECTHSNINVCHYTYITRFTSQREEVCKDNYEKICNIAFRRTATNETVQKCYRPMVQQCDDSSASNQVLDPNDDDVICKTVFESACSTRYIEKRPGKFVGDTKCEKVAKELCGRDTCQFVPGPEECHNKTLVTALDVPEETCDLVPQKTCKGVYRLVPYLVPEPVCKDVPRDVCSFGFKGTTLGEKAIVTKWCYDPREGNPFENAGPAPPSPRGERPEQVRNSQSGRKPGSNANRLPTSRPRRPKPTELPSSEILIGTVGPNPAPEVGDVIYDSDVTYDDVDDATPPYTANIDYFDDLETTPATTPSNDDNNGGFTIPIQGVASSDIQDPFQTLDDEEDEDEREGKTVNDDEDGLNEDDLELLNKIIADYDEQNEANDDYEAGDFYYYYDEEGEPLDIGGIQDGQNPVYDYDNYDDIVRLPERPAIAPNPVQEATTATSAPDDESVTESPGTTNSGVITFKGRVRVHQGIVQQSNRSPKQQITPDNGNIEDDDGDDVEEGSVVLQTSVPKAVRPVLDHVGNKEGITIGKVQGGKAPKDAEKFALAKVIQHKDVKKGISKTVIIKNNQEAFKAFGIKNVPKDFFDKANQQVEDGAIPLTPEPVNVSGPRKNQDREGPNHGSRQGAKNNAGPPNQTKPSPALQGNLVRPQTRPRGGSNGAGRGQDGQSGPTRQETGVNVAANAGNSQNVGNFARDKFNVQTNQETGNLKGHFIFRKGQTNRDAPESFNQANGQVNVQAEQVRNSQGNSQQQFNDGKIFILSNNQGSQNADNHINPFTRGNRPSNVGNNQVNQQFNSLAQGNRPNSVGNNQGSQQFNAGNNQFNQGSQQVNNGNQVLIGSLRQNQGRPNFNPGNSFSNNNNNNPQFSNGQFINVNNNGQQLNSFNQINRDPKAFGNTNGGNNNNNLFTGVSPPAVSLGPIGIEETFPGDSPSHNNPFLFSPIPNKVISLGKPSWAEEHLQPVETPLNSRPFIITQGGGGDTRPPPRFFNPSTQPKLQLPNPSVIIGGNQPRQPKTQSFIRNQAITDIQNFAVPSNPPGPTKQEQVRTQQQIIHQNQIKTHQSIFKPNQQGSSFDNRDPFNFPQNINEIIGGDENVVRTSRNPDDSYNSASTPEGQFQASGHPPLRVQAHDVALLQPAHAADVQHAGRLLAPGSPHVRVQSVGQPRADPEAGHADHGRVRGWRRAVPGGRARSGQQLSSL